MLSVVAVVATGGGLPALKETVAPAIGSSVVASTTRPVTVPGPALSTKLTVAEELAVTVTGADTADAPPVAASVATPV